jgi:hypothetical protein
MPAPGSKIVRVWWDFENDPATFEDFDIANDLVNGDQGLFNWDDIPIRVDQRRLLPKLPSPAYQSGGDLSERTRAAERSRVPRSVHRSFQIRRYHRVAVFPTRSGLDDCRQERRGLPAVQELTGGYDEPPDLRPSEWVELLALFR